MTNTQAAQSVREEVLTILRSHQSDLLQRGVKEIAVFGSIARGKSSLSSDVDILVEFSQPIGLFDFIRLKILLEKWVGRNVDLVTPDALHPALRERILKEAIYVR